jgi:hypothetical protein
MGNLILTLVLVGTLVMGASLLMLAVEGGL